MSRKERRAEKSSRGLMAFVNTFNRALELQRAGQLEEAAAVYREALAINQNVALLHNNYGAVLHDTGHDHEALIHLQRAVVMDPNLDVAHNNLGVTLSALARFQEAIPCFKRALELEPKNTSAMNNLGDAYIKLNRFKEAEETVKNAIAAQPDFFEAVNNLGSTYWGMGRIEDAIACFRRVIQLNPSLAMAHKNLGIISLLARNYAEGWREFEWRWIADKILMHPHRAPIWKGQDLDGKTLFVWSEQGVGDQVLQTALIDDLLAHKFRIIWEIDERLVPLVQRSCRDVKVVPRREPMVEELSSPDIAAQIPAVSLGIYFRKDASQFPSGRKAFLRADPERTSALRAKFNLEPHEKLIGISWVSQNPIYGHGKTIKLSDWAGILRTPGARFVDLQYGETAEERASVEGALGVPITHIDGIDLRNDLDDLAALTAACDLVITVSNTTAHIAASLGRPTWVLIAAGIGKFWYWGARGSEAPWYPTAYLHRQPDSQDWAPTLTQVASRLAQFVATGVLP